ncbi:glycoside hydrolase family 2 protein [uncultured Friedmanniella sp.]|uniref:glycoside hydrolase family 2 protein n=1 Tax=uncultured Friedmanniella sp. TaxID=335381 RepID=UPI0035CAA82C
MTSPDVPFDGAYPRPQLVRPHWCDLNGPWSFAYDDDRVGTDENWPQDGAFDRTITVPFPPESKASGIADPGFHPVVWYRREVGEAELQSAGLTDAGLTDAGRGHQGDRVLLHFGAVDYRADAWLDGQHLGHHVGGQTPFAFDVTAQVRAATGPMTLVVRAEDDPFDVSQPRGKQDWQLEPHGIWYHRTTGIWQPVWLEAVPEERVERLAWSCDLVQGTVQVDLELGRRPAVPVTVRVELRHEGELLAEVAFRQDTPRSRTVITLPRQTNGQAYESLLWSPEHPRLIDAVVTLAATDGTTLDRVGSYLGLRSVGWADGHFLLNDRPRYLRSVLAQNYWPESQLAAPSADALRAEVQLILDLGFNAARVHQKVEDPRFLAWADRLGLLVWGEFPAAFEFSATAVQQTVPEWTEVVRRDSSHPSIVTWVPLNESWGVQHIAHDPQQQAFARSLHQLTRALDPTRPVVTNDGWEQVDPDLWTIHDYAVEPEVLAASYVDRQTIRGLAAGVGPIGRRLQLGDATDRGQPVMVTEFGGVRYASSEPGSWGYVSVGDAEAYEQLLRGLFAALQSSPALAGFCYTQLTDTLQEANGLTDAERRPKLDVARIRAIVLGEPAPTGS